MQYIRVVTFLLQIISQKDEHCWVGELNGLRGKFDQCEADWSIKQQIINRFSFVSEKSLQVQLIVWQEIKGVNIGRVGCHGDLHVLVIL